MSFVRLTVVLAASLVSTVVLGQPQTESRPDDATALHNWPVAFGTIHRVSADALMLESNALPSAASHFIEIAPCRVYDSRVVAGGPGPIPSATSRTIQIAAGPCAGIPANAAGFSLNFTVTGSVSSASYAFLTAYPTGNTRPNAVTVNFLAGTQEGNAAVVPAGTGGAIDVYASLQTEVIIDINGYFVPGVVTNITAQGGLTGGGTGDVTLEIGSGQVVRSLNTLKDDVVVAAGSNVSITPSGNNLTIAAPGTSTNTANTLVQRDGSGGFEAGALTLSGKVDQTSDDGFVAKGTYNLGSIPATGEGTRMMWYPRKAALRAGYAVGAGWDDAAIGPYSSAMGQGTVASGLWSTALGYYTVASNDSATAMGYSSTASGHYSTAMGAQTIASGDASTAFGFSTKASGTWSTAMGYYASTTDNLGTPHSGTFVWGDGSTSTYVNPAFDNQFIARAAGGVIFYSNAAMTTGVFLVTGGGSWSTLSDRDSKTDFREIDNEQILSGIAALPVSSWRYKDGDPQQRFIGPVAQDFHALFGLGTDKTIATLDFDGVTLAGMKALEKRTADLHGDVVILKSENAGLRSELDARTAKVDALQHEIDRRTAEIESLRGELHQLLQRLERLETK